MVERTPLRRCAIYTRKSSEEGLDQAFNSLDAQREACAAYITSQRHEGWREVATAYDDGGFSGGSLERPALQMLLADIQARKIDIVVVYKVDRLTRSLADFAKIVEIFDRHGVSFVSVTQQFNTTSSMGRLTLNILLSFAQFEREVTGERIRDKVAASKRKGMWMGGCIPLGYDLGDRKLTVNAVEAETVRRIYRRYVELRCVRLLATELARTRVRSKSWVARTGRQMGGHSFSRGALYAILKSRLYLGEIVHRGQIHRGQHEAIVERELWQQAHQLLATNRRGWKGERPPRAPSLLAGLLFDDAGNRYGPTHTIKNAKRHRYYARKYTRGVVADSTVPARIRAGEIEPVVIARVTALLGDGGELRRHLGDIGRSEAAWRAFVSSAQALAGRVTGLDGIGLRALIGRLVRRVQIGVDRIDVSVIRSRLISEISGTSAVESKSAIEDVSVLSGDVILRHHGRGARIVIPPVGVRSATARPDLELVKAISNARRWYRRLLEEPSVSMTALGGEAGLDRSHVRRRLRLAMLAPDLVAIIVSGRQDGSLTIDGLTKAPLPLDWREQRRLFAASKA